MKSSKFNIVISKNQYSYWYNSLSRSFFKIPIEIGEKLQRVIKKITENQEIVPDFLIDKMKLGGFIVEDDVDEIQYIRNRNREAIEEKNYFLVVLPTLNCNYHCWYCIQDHIVSKMSEETLERLKRHIDHMINVEKITNLHIDWFGGEPFLYFNDVIKPISHYAMEACVKASIPFYNSTTTNGYFLNERVILSCKDLDFRHFQITLDGNREFHDKVKFQNGCDSTFAHVLNNINNILRIIDGAHIILRINYTHNNLSKQIVEEVNEYIQPDFRHRVRVTPRKVWQEGIDRSFHATLTKILNDFSNSGYSVEHWDPITNFIPCYANKKYYNAINYNGNVLKCTACDDLYDKESKGMLLDNGSIKWQDNYDKRYCEPTFENERCLRCNKLPICMGLCSREHVNGRTHCKEQVLDTSFESSIVNFIDREYEKDNF